MHHANISYIHCDQTDRTPEPRVKPPVRKSKATGRATQKPPKQATAKGFLRWLLSEGDTGPIAWDELAFLYQFYWETKSLKPVGDRTWRRDLVALGIKKTQRNVKTSDNKRKRKLHYIIEPVAALNKTGGRKKATQKRQVSSRPPALEASVLNYQEVAYA